MKLGWAPSQRPPPENREIDDVFRGRSESDANRGRGGPPCSVRLVSSLPLYSIAGVGGARDCPNESVGPRESGPGVRRERGVRKTPCLISFLRLLQQRRAGLCGSPRAASHEEGGGGYSGVPRTLSRKQGWAQPAACFGSSALDVFRAEASRLPIPQRAWGRQPLLRPRLQGRDSTARDPFRATGFSWPTPCSAGKIRGASEQPTMARPHSGGQPRATFPRISRMLEEPSHPPAPRGGPGGTLRMGRMGSLSPRTRTFRKWNPVLPSERGG